MQVNTNILDDAKSLRQSQKSFYPLIQTAESLLRHINEKIHESHVRGENSLHIPIPGMLQATGFSNSASQLYVCSAIIRALEEKNYRAQISIYQYAIDLFVTWEAQEDDYDFTTMTEFLKLHTTQKKSG